MSGRSQNGETRYRLMMRRRFRNLFDALEDLLAFVASMLRAWKQPEGGLSLYQTTLVLHVARAHNAAAGVIVLAGRGLGELAISVCRLLAEAMVSAHWMSLEPRLRAEQFREFQKLERLELGELLRELGEVKDEDIPAEHRNPEWVAKLKARFRGPTGWMQRPMDKVIHDIEPLWGTVERRKDFLGTMNILHLTGDRHSHIGASDTVRFQSERGIALGPTENAPTWAAQALKQATICYLELVDLAVKDLKLMDVAAWNKRVDRTRARMSWLRQEQIDGVKCDDLCPCDSGLLYGQCHDGVDLHPAQPR